MTIILMIKGHFKTPIMHKRKRKVQQKKAQQKKSNQIFPNEKTNVL